MLCLQTLPLIKSADNLHSFASKMSIEFRARCWNIGLIRRSLDERVRKSAALEIELRMIQRDGDPAAKRREKLSTIPIARKAFKEIPCDV